MELPHWSAELELGVKSVDDDHRIFLDMLERLEKRLLSEEAVERQLVDHVVTEMVHHLDEHFRDEEAFFVPLEQMPENEKQAHLLDHRRWVREMQSHLGPLEKATSELEYRAHLARVLRVGRGFWHEHFRNHDQRLVGYLTKR